MSKPYSAKDELSAIAYTDGSFNPATFEYGSGALLLIGEDRALTIQHKGDNSEYARSRNVAGEIFAAVSAIDFAKRNGVTHLTIFHDYEGISKWPMCQWKCNKELTARYAKYVQAQNSSSVHITFEHVKGHSGNPLNDYADSLAAASLAADRLCNKYICREVKLKLEGNIIHEIQDT